jgi:carbonic anhydrase
MMFARSALLSALAISAPLAAFAAEGNYNYDFADPVLGPDGWKDLPISFNQCGGGSNSPIAVTATECGRTVDYSLENGDCKIGDLDFQTVNNGVKAFFTGECTKPSMNIPGVDGTYNALQFHIHTASEHSIGDMFYDLELHVVHQLDVNTGSGQFDPDSSTGPSGERNGFAVVGMVFSKGGPSNPEFQKFIDGWKANQSIIDSSCGSGRKLRKEDARKAQEALASAYGLLDRQTDFFFYSGGLTTPPCSEVVWWNLSSEPVVISDAQYQEIVDLTLGYKDENCTLATIADPVSGSTSRPPQPLNGREVIYSCPDEGLNIVDDVLDVVGGVGCGLLGLGC